MRNLLIKRFVPVVTVAVSATSGAIAAPVILNPSFESVTAEMTTTNSLNNNNSASPTDYAARIDNWTPTLNGGRFGSVNGGEFNPPGASDGSRLLGLGMIPQSTGSMSIQQSVSGWDPSKVYLLRLDASSRDALQSDMHAFAGAQQIVNVAAVPNGGLSTYQSVFFTPPSSTANLTLQTTQTGDRTLWVDNLHLLEFTSVGSGLVKNPSMEIDARSNFNGAGYGNVSGWRGASGINTNDGSFSPFADNGTMPSAEPVGDYGDNADVGSESVLFKQGSGDITQRIAGLVAGQQYALSFVENTRNGDSGPGNASVSESALVGGVTVVTAHVVGSGSYVPQNGTFTVTGGMLDAEGYALLDFKIDVPAGDRSWLLDNVSIVAVPEPASLGMLAIAGSALLARRKRA